MVTRGITDPVVCVAYAVQTGVGYMAWMFVFGAVFMEPWAGAIVHSLAVAVVAGGLSTGCWVAVLRVSPFRMAAAYSAVAISFALLSLLAASDARHLHGALFFCGVAATFYASSALGGWLVLRAMRSGAPGALILGHVRARRVNRSLRRCLTKIKSSFGVRH